MCPAFHWRVGRVVEVDVVVIVLPVGLSQLLGTRMVVVEEQAGRRKLVDKKCFSDDEVGWSVEFILYDEVGWCSSWLMKSVVLDDGGVDWWSSPVTLIGGVGW